MIKKDTCSRKRSFDSSLGHGSRFYGMLSLLSRAFTSVQFIPTYGDREKGQERTVTQSKPSVDGPHLHPTLPCRSAFGSDARTTRAWAMPDKLKSRFTGDEGRPSSGGPHLLPITEKRESAAGNARSTRAWAIIAIHIILRPPAATLFEIGRRKGFIDIVARGCRNYYSWAITTVCGLTQTPWETRRPSSAGPHLLPITEKTSSAAGNAKGYPPENAET
ncbi:hypothetical protein B0H15DRAFT_933510 [Mycena belliarum]|uniref:Uncharacterized protein n=1 Tax=Mycena belliarum TaxID=1033014 RepID=A0AAD6TX62_9AGAR|nr:hypothetical protein B0H15DRAFT_933510 [Mycena belliae]